MKIGTGVHSRTQNGKISDVACIDGLTASHSSCLNAGAPGTSGEAPREECYSRKASQEAKRIVCLSLFWHVSRRGQHVFSAPPQPHPPACPGHPTLLPRLSRGTTPQLHPQAPCRRTTLGGLSFCLFTGARRQSSAAVLAFPPIR
jgi:hypothetical protein